MLLKPVPLVRDNSKETRKRTLRLEQLEERIRDLEKEIQTCSRELQKVSQNGAFESMHKISNQMAKAQATLDELLHEWGQLVG
jgi:archaellum component FlaC